MTGQLQTLSWYCLVGGVWHLLLSICQTCFNQHTLTKSIYDYGLGWGWCFWFLKALNFDLEQQITYYLEEISWVGFLTDDPLQILLIYCDTQVSRQTYFCSYTCCVRLVSYTIRCFGYSKIWRAVNDKSFARSFKSQLSLRISVSIMQHHSEKQE